MEEKIKIEVIPEESEQRLEAPETNPDGLPQEAPADADEDELIFEDLDLELLLAGVSRHTADMYLQKCLAPLDEADRELLLVYFATEMSLKRTAELLFLHKNTLQYRLNRIRERCGYDPRIFREAVVLYTALRLEQVAG